MTKKKDKGVFDSTRRSLVKYALASIAAGSAVSGLLRGPGKSMDHVRSLCPRATVRQRLAICGDEVGPYRDQRTGWAVKS